MRRGTRVANAYIAATVDGSGINEDIVDAVDDAGPGVERAGEDHGERYGEAFDEGFASRMRERFSGSRLGSLIGGRRAGADAGDVAGESFVERMSDKVRDMGDKIGAELGDRLASNPEQIRRGVDRAFDDDFLDRVGERLGHRIGDRLGDSLRESIDRQSGMLAAAIESAVSGNGSGGGSRRGGGRDGIAGVVERMFGGGSRNNFLNVLGKSMGGIVGLVEKAGSFAGTFASNMNKAGEGAGLVARLMAGLGGGGGGAGAASMFARLAAAGPAAVAAIGAVILALSVMASVIGAVLGLLTALISTIASGLVGALAVAGPLLGALAVTGGLVTAAFTSMTNAQIAYLRTAFQPLKAEMTGIGQIIMTQWVKPMYDGQSAVQVWSSNLQRAMLPLAGVAKETAGAFADAGNTITASLSGPGFQRFFTALGSQLPIIVRKLAVALGGFLNGIAGMFAVIMPYVTQFSRYLAETATRFSEWANSAKGQNAISDFVGRAVESLKSLWGFVKQVGGFISDVFFSPVSQKAGNSIFDSLANAFEGFRRKFNRAVKDGSVERWFNDAIKFGSSLWGVLSAIGDVFLSLYNSGVIAAVSGAFDALAFAFDAANVLLRPLVDALGYVLPGVLAVAITPIVTLAAALLSLGEVVEYLGGLLGIGNGSEGITKPFADAFDLLNTLASYTPGQSRPNGFIGPIAPGLPGNYQLPQFTIPQLTTSGNTALNNTYEQYGGYMPDPSESAAKDGKKYGLKPADVEWVNGSKAWAEQMLKQAQSVADDIRAIFREARDDIKTAFEDSFAAMADMIKDVAPTLLDGITEASKSFDADAVVASFKSIIDQSAATANAAVQAAYDAADKVITDAAAARDRMIATAEAARQSALQAVANATSPEERKAALKALKKADDDLALAYAKGEQLMLDARKSADEMRRNADATQSQIGEAQRIMAEQVVVSIENVNELLKGNTNINATLADYAMARGIVAEQLEAANQRLAEAIGMRDQYAQTVADGLRSFGSLLSAQAKTVDGVEQALTADDITDNLTERLAKIRKFNADLRYLLAQGLSDTAYKQLLDAGVEGAGAYVDALVEGGQGSISEVNSLLEQIDGEATALGNSAANTLYQAGVDAAQGLVDGLTSLAGELEDAATLLGWTVGNAVRAALGLELLPMPTLPDRNPGVRPDTSIPRPTSVSGGVAVSPEVAAYANAQGASATTAGYVSGNDAPKFVWTGSIVTPTEDPEKVATEVLNELTGRLP